MISPDGEVGGLPQSVREEMLALISGAMQPFVGRKIGPRVERDMRAALLKIFRENFPEIAACVPLGRFVDEFVEAAKEAQ